MAEIKDLRAFDQRQVAASIDRTLIADPLVETRNKKCLGDEVTADFEYVPPLWELRVGELRVFYTGDKKRKSVVVHAVRRKPPHKTTSEVVK
jgi:Phage derived protein Gp49-like (DUF891)